MDRTKLEWVKSTFGKHIPLKDNEWLEISEYFKWGVPKEK